MTTDYYTLLGVSHEALPEEIRRAYHRLAKQYHPDVYKGTDGDIRFKLLGEAYRTLIDPDMRRRYDYALRYGPLADFRSQAEKDRSRRPHINEEILRRRREQSRREREMLRKRFRYFDRFIFWSLLAIVSSGLVMSIIDLIINMRFAGTIACIMIIILLFAAYNRSRKG
jgi:curved DNA-binding protein CbpA